MILLLALLAGAPPAPGYHPKVSVAGPTRLDWTFVVSTRSLTDPPKDWLGDHDSTSQSYELFVPKTKGKAALPAIVFISPGNEPGGWRAFEKLCKARGMVFIGPRGAGNDCPGRKRVRIVLDALDDVRRNFTLDPDRTYITGFSGGGRMAAAIGFALPEAFGGVMPICASGTLREEPWLRQRVQDRLSVAVLTGEKDFNRGEVERLAGTYFKAIGVRSRTWTQPGLGHAIPGEKVLGEALTWMEDGAKARAALAKKHPASRFSVTDRDRQAQALFDEGTVRMKEPKSFYAGLMQLKGVLDRWPDTAVGTKAKEVLLAEQEKPERPWEKDDLAEQRRFVGAQARALEAYAMGDLPAVYEKQRKAMLGRAVELYEQLGDAESKKRIEAIRKKLGGE